MKNKGNPEDMTLKVVKLQEENDRLKSMVV